MSRFRLVRMMLNKPRRSIPNVDCETARRIIQNMDMSDKDLAISSSVHLARCAIRFGPCRSWLNHNPTILGNLQIMQDEMKKFYKEHPEYKRPF